MRMAVSVHPKTAVQIATATLRRRDVRILSVRYRGDMYPTIAVADPDNRTGREWYRYAWGVETNGRKWAKYTTLLAGCRLVQTFEIVTPCSRRRVS